MLLSSLMGFDFFSRTSNYSQMLNRITVFNFIISVVTIRVTRAGIPHLDALLSQLPETGEVMGVKISVGTILPALVIAVMSRAVKLHDRLSDLLRIRKNFDINQILLPFAVRTIGTVPDDKLALIEKHRESLMDKVFYAYASSSANRAVIDPHLIEAALDQWSWFWSLLEGSGVLIVAAIAFLISGSAPAACVISGIVGVFVSLMIWMYSQCGQNASKQITAILTDPERKNRIAEVFRAL